MTRGEALMKCSETVGEDPKAITVWFKKIDTDSGETDRTWKADLPKYTPPPPSTAAVSNH